MKLVLPSPDHGLTIARSSERRAGLELKNVVYFFVKRSWTKGSSNPVEGKVGITRKTSAESQFQCLCLVLTKIMGFRHF
jgi:hypothetical protein